MAEEVVFELRASENNFDGGSVALPEGKTLDIGKRLKGPGGGKGKIVTSNEHEINVLDRQPALKRVSKRARKASASKAAKAAANKGGGEDAAADNGENGGNA